MFDDTISFDNTNDNLEIDTILNVDDELVKEEKEPSVAVALGVIAVTAVGTGLAFYAINKLAHKMVDAAFSVHKKAVEEKEQKEDNE